MDEIEVIKDKIAKKQIQLGKINKRIEKWSKGMNEEAKELAKNYGYKEYDDPKRAEYKDAYINLRINHSKDNNIYNQNDWNKGPNIQELVSAYQDLWGLIILLINIILK